MTRTTFYNIGIAVTSCFQVNAQQYTAQLLDAQDMQPVAYANIGLLGTSYATNSDSLGNFTLTIPDEMKDRMLSVAIIGYESYKMQGSEWIRLLSSNNHKVYLQKKPRELSEVVVKPAKLTQARLGSYIICSMDTAGGLPFPFLFEGKRKSGVLDTLTEIGTLMKVKRKKTFIDSVKINVGICTHPEILYRINVYEETDGDFNNILQEPVYIRLNRENVGQEITVDLTSLNLVVNNNFIVSIEKVKELGAGSFTICGKMFGPPMFMRIASRQDMFVKLPVVSMGISAYVTFSEKM